MKGTEAFPSSIKNMTRDEQVEQIQKYLEPLLEEDVFLVDLKIKAINNIKIFLDADNGLAIERCIKINRAIYKIVEETGMYPEGDFSLEVSSPGIDEPLKTIRQYIKNIGRDVEVTKKDETSLIGKLLQVDENSITIEYTEGKNKKAVVIQAEIPFEEIIKTIVQIKF